MSVGRDVGVWDYLVRQVCLRSYPYIMMFCVLDIIGIFSTVFRLIDSDKVLLRFVLNQFSCKMCVAGQSMLVSRKSHR